jgi:hypothetical protein
VKKPKASSWLDESLLVILIPLIFARKFHVDPGTATLLLMRKGLELALSARIVGVETLPGHYPSHLTEQSSDYLLHS